MLKIETSCGISVPDIDNVGDVEENVLMPN